jgi:signal transduction histidine kinase
LTEKKRFFPIKTRVALLILAATLAAVGVFYLCANSGYNYIEKTYMSQAATNARVRVDLAKFQAYVRENKLSSNDLDSLAQWTRQNRYIHILIFQDKLPMAEVGSGSASSLVGSQYAAYYQAVSSNYSFSPITFSDGIFRVSVDDYSYNKYYAICDIASLILAFLVVLTAVLLYVGRLSNRVRRLSAAAQEIENGNLDCSIPSSGGDEISLLAGGMDSMRLSVQERIRSEASARQANVDLIAAISHDIRTPLTTLIGYLELLQGGTYSSDAQRDEYVGVAHEKAMRLKELTDELFRYFLVFSQTEIPSNVETMDAQILLEQLFGEHIIELRTAGWRVQVNPLDTPCSVKADAMCLKHVLDNVFSNAKKHGDREKPVIILAGIENDGRLHVSVTNSIPPTPNKVESTRVGLRTCEKMMKASGGEFRTVSDGDKFMAEIIVPLDK